MTRVLVPNHIEGAAPLLGARVQRLRGESMGTTWQLLWADRDAVRQEAVRAAGSDPGAGVLDDPAEDDGAGSPSERAPDEDGDER